MPERAELSDDTFIVRQRKETVIVVFPTGFVLTIPNHQYEEFVNAIDQFDSTHTVPGAE